jgi:hypothetical protein
MSITPSGTGLAVAPQVAWSRDDLETLHRDVLGI